MDNITTHREYEALDKEIKDASERESQLVWRCLEVGPEETLSLFLFWGVPIMCMDQCGWEWRW